MGATLYTIKASTAASTGTQHRKIRLSRAFMKKASPTPMISMEGPRTMGRSPPLTAFCSTVISVVIRVISDEVSNRSRSEKEYS